MAEQDLRILRFCTKDGISRGGRGRMFKTSFGLSSIEGQRTKQALKWKQTTKKVWFRLSYFYFLYLYERGISGRGSLWWSRVCGGGARVSVYVCYKAIFSSEGRLTFWERRASDCQLICFSNFSKFQGKLFRGYRYIRRQQSTVNFVKDFIRQQGSESPTANSWSMCISIAWVTGTRWSLETFIFTQDLRKWNV